MKVCLLTGLLLASVFAAGAKDRMEAALASMSAEPRMSADALAQLVDSLDSMPLSEVEGLWGITAEEGTFVIIADSSSDRMYRMVVVDAADRNVLPGSVMGVVAPTAARGVYDARIYSSADDDGVLSRPKRFTLTLADDSRLTFRPVNKGLKVNLIRLIPYMFRAGLRQVDDRQQGIDGALRLAPSAKAWLSKPYYL